ncbi:HEAT repeat domain-containing protein [Pseudomonas fragi]|nr:HEAT repeat domain-containing protein [Pseudomonas fragi]
MDINAAITQLIKLMEDGLKPDLVRAAAAEGLGYAGGPAARAALSRLMDDGLKPVTVRVAAAKALGRATKE